MTVVSEIIDRLQDADTPFALVQGAAELSLVKDRPRSTPAAYVLAAKETSGENRRVNGPVYQRLERDVSVIMVASNLSDEDGAAAADDIEALKTYVRGRLVGFLTTDAADPITHVQGEIVQAAKGAVWFEDVFAVSGIIEQEQS